MEENNTLGLIRILPELISNKIAAGEVVQRPASVVKELLDNALDAGASEIEVVLDEAGRTLVQVRDNGSGLSRADIPLCFKRHATSKIRDVDDLYRIRSYGFRGEALASIASVAQVTLQTRQHDAEHGWKYEIWGGDQRSFEPVAFPLGTEISVRNLFYNVPARRAFLKTRQTEFRHCMAAIEQLALANADVGFALIADGSETLRVQPESLKARICSLLGREYEASLIEVEQSTPSLKVSGFLGDPMFSRKNRGDQFFFVNGRPFQHRFLFRMMMEEYAPWTREGDFPFFSLFFELHPSHIDVNVHPTKLEVKFDDERGLVSLTRSVVKKALNQRYQVPEIPNMRVNDFDRDFQKMLEQPIFKKGNEAVQRSSRINFAQGRIPEDVTGQVYDLPVFLSKQTNDGTQHESHRATTGGITPEKGGFWQLHTRFIVAHTLQGLCLIDQSAAHRRILYEQVLDQAKAALPSTQQLLFPQTIHFSASDFSLLEELRSTLETMGFDIQMLSGFSVILSGVPTDLEIGDEKGLLHHILQSFQELGHLTQFDPRERLALAFAKRLAMQPGKRLTEKEMESLVDRLFSCEFPFIDPLKKPTINYISLEEIAARFRP